MGQRKDYVDPYKVACPRCLAAVRELCFRLEKRARARRDDRTEKVHKERAAAARASMAA
jgi:hypothetical protein